MLTVVIPSYKNKKNLKKCLKAIKSSTHKEFNIIVVDDGAFNKYWLEKGKNITGLYTSLAQGFTCSVNLGIKKSFETTPEADVVLINNDCFIDQNCLGEFDRLSHIDPKIGIIGAKLYFPNKVLSKNRLQHAGAFINKYGRGEHIGGCEIDVGQYDVINECEYVTFACVFLKNAMIREIGFLEEIFSPYFYEDVDYCYKAHQKGWKVVFNYKAKAVHLEGASTLKVDRMKTQEISLVNREKFFNKWKSPPLVEKNKKYKVAFYSTPYELNQSYELVLRNLAKALDKTDETDVAIYEEKRYPQNITDWHIKVMMNKSKVFEDRIPIRYAEGNKMYIGPAKKIGYTTLESDILPEDWVFQLNQCHQVWTTSSFSREIFINSGVKRPIYIVPHGINPSIFNDSINPINLKDIGLPELKNKFIFLSVFHYGPRKNPEILFRAFTEEFKKDKDVVLLLHGSTWASLGAQGISPIKYFWDLTGKLFGYRIYFSERTVTDVLLARLYKRCNAFILLGNEGFGLPGLEAMATGLPSIFMDYGGIKEFANENNSSLVSVDKMIPARQDFLFQNYLAGKWAQPSIEEVRSKMRYVYENYDDLKTKSVQNSLSIRQNFSWERAAEKAVAALKNY